MMLARVLVLAGQARNPTLCCEQGDKLSPILAQEYTNAQQLQKSSLVAFLHCAKDSRPLSPFRHLGLRQLTLPTVQLIVPFRQREIFSRMHSTDSCLRSLA